MKRKDRRTEQRVRIELGAQIGVETVPPEGGEAVVNDIAPCVISDLSLGGARIALLTHRTMALNLRVRLFLEIDHRGKKLELSGIVRWREIHPGSAAHRLGVEFLVPKKVVLERWVAYINDVIANAPPEDLLEDTSDPWPW